MLLRYALDTHKAAHNDLVLSFFLHGYGDELQRSPLGIFRSILHQVIREIPNSLPILLDTFGKKRMEIGKPGEK